MLTKRILGIDPGSRVTGYGCIECVSTHQSPKYIASGYWRLKEEEMSQRLSELYGLVRSFILEFRPTGVAIEQVFVHKNAMSALKLGQARGVAIAAAASDHLPVYEYAPKAIKQAVVGTGQGQKTQVQQMVKFLLRLESLPQADEADALAVAICHAHSQNSWESQHINQEKGKRA